LTVQADMEPDSTNLNSINVGNAAEAAFVYSAIVNGLSVSRPMFDIEKYDFITDSRVSLHRIQVKSVLTGTKANVAYGKNRKDRYTPAHCDFIAVWVAQQNTWYIIPTDEVESRTINLNEKYSKYRELWSQLH
jgi:hypothetical protein